MIGWRLYERGKRAFWTAAAERGNERRRRFRIRRSWDLRAGLACAALRAVPKRCHCHRGPKAGFTTS